jgi:hypothetical protein
MGDEKIKIYCVRCQGTTNHDVLKSISRTLTPATYPSMEIDFAEGAWEILECRGCEEITFRETWVTSEDIDPFIGVSEPTIRLFPPRSEKTRPIKPIYNVSPTLRHIYRETIDCYNQGSNILCAIGIRALIEGVCSDKGIKNGSVKGNDGTTKLSSNLEGKIEGMAEKGLLTKAHASTLHELRFLGNEAAHELKAPSLNDLEIAIEIIEHTLENIYELGPKAETLHWKKQKG